MMNSSEFAEKSQENTIHYIENYLTPFQKWSIITPAKERLDLIRHADVNWEVISDHIKKMDYRDFLATPYWKAIAAHTKYRARYRCQVCNYGHNLITHHRNYAIHGQEHANIHELIVLCRYCHDKFHDSHNSKARVAQPIMWIRDLTVLLGFVSIGVASWLFL